MDRQVYYVNQIVVVSSNFDVQLKMKSVSPLVNDNFEPIGSVINEEVDIIMSPEHAKALLIALDKNLKEHEVAKVDAPKKNSIKNK